MYKVNTWWAHWLETVQSHVTFDLAEETLTFKVMFWLYLKNCKVL